MKLLVVRHGGPKRCLQEFTIAASGLTGTLAPLVRRFSGGSGSSSGGGY
jgi:hypothetical protein